MAASIPVRIIASLALAGIAAPLIAAPADVVKARQQGYKQMGGAFKGLNDGLRAPSPDVAKLKAAAVKVRATAAQQYKWFPKGTGPEARVKTGAKPEIWTQPAKFLEMQKAFESRAVALEKAAATGNVDAIRTAARATGAACKGCHDQFRNEDD